MMLLLLLLLANNDNADDHDAAYSDLGHYSAVEWLPSKLNKTAG